MININYSSTYSFQKPISDEKYNIGVFNTNMDLIDSVLNRMEKKNESQDESIAKAQADIDNEVSRATEKEKKLEQDLQDEVIRASSAENEISNDLSLEIDRAVNSEESIRTDLSTLISALTERLNTLADSDDTTLDQLSEIVAYIKNNKDLIDGITTAIPTKTSQLMNDNGYITSADVDSDVTGVKGNAESSYRKGNVNLTPANIGALPDATVPINKGGTGQTTAVNAANAFINALSTGASTPADNDYFISQYVNGGTATTTYHRRPLSALWTYIKNKINAATDIKATKDGQGNVIEDTYDRNGIKLLAEGVVVATDTRSIFILPEIANTQYKLFLLVQMVEYESTNKVGENSGTHYCGWIINNSFINISSNFSNKFKNSGYGAYGIDGICFTPKSGYTYKYKAWSFYKSAYIKA